MFHGSRFYLTEDESEKFNGNCIVLRNMVQVSPASPSSSSSDINPQGYRLVIRVYSHFIHITWQTYESFKQFFTKLDVTPDPVGLFNQELHIIFTSQRAAANEAVTLWHLSRYTLTLEIKGFSMTLLEMSLYAMENASRTRITTLSRVNELLSETLLEDVARILSDKRFTVACSWNAVEMVIFLRNTEQKISTPEESNCGNLKLGGLPWYVVTSLGTDRRCRHKEMKLDLIQSSFRRYLDFVRIKKYNLSKDVHDAFRRYKQVYEPHCPKGSTRRLEVLLQRSLMSVLSVL